MDSVLNPKIADFGMARETKLQQTQIVLLEPRKYSTTHMTLISFIALYVT